MDAQVSKCMGSMGVSKTWDEWLAQDIPNRDLILKYVSDLFNNVHSEGVNEMNKQHKHETNEQYLDRIMRIWKHRAAKAAALRTGMTTRWSTTADHNEVLQGYNRAEQQWVTLYHPYY